MRHLTPGLHALSPLHSSFIAVPQRVGDACSSRRAGKDVKERGGGGCRGARERRHSLRCRLKDKKDTFSPRPPPRSFEVVHTHTHTLKKRKAAAPHVQRPTHTHTRAHRQTDRHKQRRRRTQRKKTPVRGGYHPQRQRSSESARQPAISPTPPTSSRGQLPTLPHPTPRSTAHPAVGDEERKVLIEARGGHNRVRERKMDTRCSVREP